jgi:hypothetical protein
MSARKVGNADLFQPVTVQTQATRLSLSASDISIRKSGIEFRSSNAIPVWTEMTVELQTPLEPRKLHCSGVVVACPGNRHAGYVVSLVFTHISRQTQERLNSLALSH